MDQLIMNWFSSVKSERNSTGNGEKQLQEEIKHEILLARVATPALPLENVKRACGRIMQMSRWNIKAPAAPNPPPSGPNRIGELINKTPSAFY